MSSRHHSDDREQAMLDELQQLRAEFNAMVHERNARASHQHDHDGGLSVLREEVV